MLVFAAVLITVSGFTQKTADIGLWGGTSTYFGDMRGTGHFQQFNPNFGAYFRYNFDARIALRAMFITGRFAEEGYIEGITAPSLDKQVQDLSLQVEINYLKYILGVKNTPYTSYVLVGVGVAYFPYYSNPPKMGVAYFPYYFHPANTDVAYFPYYFDPPYKDKEPTFAPTIPFGIGFKYTLGQRWEVGIEYLMRKMFVDKLDDLDDPLAYINLEGQQVTYTDFAHNNDWSAYLGLHLTYKIYLGKKACPAYDSKN